MNPRQTEHDIVKEFNEGYPPFARRLRSIEETCRAQDFVIWEDPASDNDHDSENSPVSYRSGSLYCPANSHTRVSASPSARTDTWRMSEEDVKALDLMMARSTHYSFAYASDNTFNEDDEKDDVQRGFIPPSRVRNYTEESRARPQGPRLPLVDITTEKIAASITELNQSNANVQPAPRSPTLALAIGRTKPNFCSSPLQRMATVAEEYEESKSAVSDNISEASTEYGDENAVPSKYSPRKETSLFPVSPYKNSTPEQFRAWRSTGEDSGSDIYVDENQPLEEFQSGRNPTEYVITASSFSSPYSKTPSDKSRRCRRRVALFPPTAVPHKISRRSPSTGVQSSRSHSKENAPWHRRRLHAGLTVGIPVCYVNENNPEPLARTPRGMASRSGGGCAPARLFTPKESSGIDGFWGGGD